MAVIGLLCLIFLLTSLTFCSQETYLVDGHYNNIYKLESDYSVTLVTTFDDQSSFNFTGDIAIDPDGVIYGVTRTGKIFRINLFDSSTQTLSYFPFVDQFSYISLACSNGYELYTLNSLGDLYTYNILTNTINFLEHLGTSTPGDLTFYKGNLIFQATTDLNIKAFNLGDHTLSNILCVNDEFSCPNGSLYGLSNLFSDCNSEVIYSTDCYNVLYELNIS